MTDPVQGAGSAVAGLPEIARRIREGRAVTVMGHTRPDADAVGSVTALVAGLKQVGIPATGAIGQLDRFPENLYTIPGAAEIDCPRSLPSDGLVVAVDCGSLDRLGRLAEDAAADPDRLIVIDHHASNDGFGGLNYIDPEVESTTTIVFELLQLLGIALTPDIAHGLYAGLVTDTGSFRRGSPRMHALAAELMATGIDTERIGRELMDAVDALDLRMIGSVLSGIDVLSIDGVAVATLFAPVELIAGHSASAVESLVDFMYAITGVDLGVVFKATSTTTWAVSLRSRTMDVSRIAVRLGGGGHTPAAGYSSRGSRQEVLLELIDAVKASRSVPRSARVGRANPGKGAP